MNDKQLRLECLKTAALRLTNLEEILATAKKYEAYVFDVSVPVPDSKKEKGSKKSVDNSQAIFE